MILAAVEKTTSQETRELISRSDVIIAIDGASATGKTTLAVALAERYDLIVVDTGLSFRTLAYLALLLNLAIYNNRQQTWVVAEEEVLREQLMEFSSQDGWAVSY